MALSHEKRIYGGILAAAACLLAMAAFSVRSAHSFRDATTLVEHTVAVERQIESLMAAIKRTDVSYRDFLITGDKSHLERPDGQSVIVPAELERLRQLTKDNAERQTRLVALSRLITGKLEATQAGVTQRGQSTDAAAVMVPTLSNPALGKDIESIVAEITAAEKGLLEARQAQARRDGVLSEVAMGCGLFFSAVLLLMLFRMVRLREADAAALKRQAAEVSDLYNHAPCGYHSVDANGVFIAVNDTELKWLGYQREELIGKMRHADLHTPESRVRYLEEFERFKREGVARDVELELVRRDGTTMPVLVNATLVRDAGGNYVASRTTLYDNTERRRAEQFTRQAREYAESIVETIPEPLLILTSGLEVRSANRSFYNVFDLKPTQTVGRPLAEIGGGKWNLPGLIEKLKRIEPDHSVVENFEVAATFPRIGPRVMLVHARKLYRPGNNTKLLLLVIEDVTQRKRLQEVHLQFRALFESLPGLYVVLTPDFTIVAVSDAFLQATMTEREDIMERGLFDVFPDNPDDAQASGTSNLRASLERVLATGLTDTMAIQRYDVRAPDGIFEVRFWSPINSPVLGVDRKVEYIIHRVEDVTEFMQNRAKAAGEQDVRSRLELMEAEIYSSSQAVQTANQKLRAANEELESFSYSVSHDLRAPLRHISGFSQMLEQHLGELADDKAKHYLHTIASSSRQMGALIDGLLAFSRIGRVEMRRQKVSLAQLVDTVVKNLSHDIGQRKVEWKIDELPEVHGDFTLLRQVFANLLGNAVKYTSKKEEAHVEVRLLSESVEEFVLCVSDNGAGFDQRYAGKLFGVFQRLHTAGEFEGNGVGLATVRRIVQRHGGRVWAEGKPGVGASFFLSFPKNPSGQNHNHLNE